MEKREELGLFTLFGGPEKIEIPTPTGTLTIHEPVMPVIDPGDIPQLMLAAFTVAVASSFLSFATTMISAPMNFLMMRLAIDPMIKRILAPVK